MEAPEPEVDEGRTEQGSEGTARVAAIPPLVRLAVGFYAIVAVFAFGYALFSSQVGTLFGEMAPTWPGLLGGVAIGLVVVGLLHLGTRMWKTIAEAARAIGELIGPIRVRDAAILAGVSAVGEELLFRGAMWTQLGLVGTSLLFGLVHVVPRRALWAYPLYAASAGLLLGVLRHGSHNVVPPILAHFTINFLCLWWISRQQALPEASELRSGDGAEPEA